MNSLIPFSPSSQMPVPMPQNGAWEVVLDRPSGPQSDSWLFWLPRWVSRKATTTQAVYAAEARCFLDWLHWKPLTMLTTLDIEAYQQHLAVRGDKPNTIVRKVATVCSLVSYIHKRDQTVMPRNVGAGVERVKSDDRLAERILSERELLRIFDRTENPRDLALLRTLYGGGLRISEAIGLRWQDVVWRDKDALLTVLGKGSKLRTVAIYGEARAALLAIAPAEPNPEAFVFQTVHGAMNRIYCVEIVRRAAVRAGITRKVSPHWLRHAAASHALDHKAPLALVSRTLGHSNLATTGRYVHVRPEESLGKYLSV